MTPHRKESPIPAITPSLWFDNNLEEAAEFYTSVFPNSSIDELHRTTEAGPGEPGDVLSGFFVLDGTRFIGINVRIGYQQGPKPVSDDIRESIDATLMRLR